MRGAFTARFLLAACAVGVCAAGAGENALLKRLCECEEDVGSRAHENALDRLNGRKVVFIGDSVPRYQYLSLAYYIAHETCFCSRLGVESGKVNEQRSFAYSDVEFSLAYVQNFSEAYAPVRGALTMAEALRPTQVLLAFGVWLQWAPRGCDRDDVQLARTAPELAAAARRNRCPSMDFLCKVFDPAELARLSHPFTLWWQTPPPVARNDTLLEVLDDTHHLNVRTRCRLPDALVVDRCAALDALEPNRALQRRFWWAGGEEQPHLHAEANHAFNHALLHKLEAVPPRMRSPLWRAMSTGGARLRRLLGAAA